jgi:uncharacterized membrane protein YbhN (UPF0104 family)
MRGRRVSYIISALISLAIGVLAYGSRHEISAAFTTLQTAEPLWLVAALATIALSYLLSAQVFAIALRSLGHRMSVFRLWGTALTAIVMSQSVPAGGVASYAFLANTFRRHGVAPGAAALVASLETLSYVAAMLIVFAFSLIYLAWQGFGALGISALAGLIGLAVLGAALFVLSRPVATLRRWLQRVEGALARIVKPGWSGRVAAELTRGRALIAGRRGNVALLVLIQLGALIGHSLALLFVLRGLGVAVGLPVVVTAFGVALVTSTFNVLPGGGGTVEAALVAVLINMGVGPAAVPAAIIFRLFNFWLVAPLALVAYHWLTNAKAPVTLVRKRGLAQIARRAQARRQVARPPTVHARMRRRRTL